LEKSKIDFEKHEMNCKNSSHFSDSKFCKNCKTLENKIHYLVRTVHKLSKGKSNFETVLASQKCVFVKSGLGFYPRNKQKMGFQRLFQKCRKNNRLKDQNNWLLHAFTARREATLLDSVKLGNIFFLKVS